MVLLKFHLLLSNKVRLTLIKLTLIKEKISSMIKGTNLIAKYHHSAESHLITKF